jgi:hypothetical protein
MKKAEIVKIMPWIKSQGFECSLKRLGAMDALFIESEKRKSVNGIEIIEDLAIVTPDNHGWCVIYRNNDPERDILSLQNAAKRAMQLINKRKHKKV